MDKCPANICHAGELLNRLEDPLLVLAADGKVVYRNAAVQRIVEKRADFSIRNERLRLENTISQLELDDAIKAISSGACSSRAMRYPRPSATHSRIDSRDWMILLTRLASQNALIVVHLVGRLNPRRPLPKNTLVDLFGLTKQEIALLTAFCRRLSLRQIADQMKLSHETVRIYLKRVFKKCGVNSQEELLALLHKLNLVSC